MPHESSAETIQRVLSSYEIGRKLRQLRLRKKIALTDLAAHTGLSPSLISQLENGKMTPTLPTLARIAMVFDIGLEHFFGEKRGKKLFSIVLAGERMRFPERADEPKPAYFFECLAFSSQSKGMQAYLADFPASEEASREHFHEGSEFLHVLEGKLWIRFENEEHELGAGDTLHMDSSEPHAYRGAPESGARALVITWPPRI
ncbi:MAG: helix-turn-helix transcriptional regulator [Acidobacteriota bacterium]|nr:helix-turn-helix transcriptional regulator [Acidobacteriota bacterium]